MNREQIYSALFALMGGIEGVRFSSRKLKHWADVSDFPAIFQTQKTEHITKSGRGVPTKYDLYVDIYVYVKSDSGDSAAPLLNDMLDLIEQALAAPESISNKQTLGGLVHDCYIDGQLMTDEGNLGDTGVAIIPIHIITAAT